MNSIYRIVAFTFLSCLVTSNLVAQTLEDQVTPLIESSCVYCHDAETETGLNFEALGHDLGDKATFRQWEKIFDRVSAGEMPPASEGRPDANQLKVALASLKQNLHAASVARQQQVGRVPARRLTKLELGHTLRDLLLIEGDVTSSVPDEVESGSFDTVGSAQRISAVHMESYLQAADEALGLAIKLGRNPYRSIELKNFAHLDQWHEKPINQGGSITRKLKFGKGFALFRDVDYLTQFRIEVITPGQYRISARVAAFQSKSPLTAKFIVKDQGGGARLAKSVDLNPREPETISFVTYLQPGETPYLTFDDTEVGNSLFTAGGAKHYRGPGLAIMSQKVEGPLFESWPPPSTHQLFGGLELINKGSDQGPFAIQQSKSPLEHVVDVVQHFAPRLFRREVTQNELQPFLDLTRPAIAEGRGLTELVRIPLSSMLTSPQFLMFESEPGELDHYALANRLSYFLWKSMPDDELFALAKEGKLSDPKILAQQVDRMLKDEKSNRFVRDFVGQWLRLDKVNATTPDDGLYPEYDELLADAIPRETELFFAELINENLGATNLIDSDFTFVNRRLAELYDLPDVQGQEFRKVSLPEDSPRGGVLVQAAVLKTTANGTTTSPVMRGNFVLTNFFGTPPSPPPPGIGSIEPDTRGKTTVREILKAHRKMESCNQCHREIDPPGFALESFDPIGGFRTHYRASGGERTFGGFVTKLPPRQGPPVDASGVTSDGQPFAGIQEFKRLLLEQKDQVARNFISQLVVYSTGGEIQFADRDQLESILDATRPNDFPVKDIIHQIVQSELFRNK